MAFWTVGGEEDGRPEQILRPITGQRWPRTRQAPKVKRREADVFSPSTISRSQRHSTSTSTSTQHTAHGWGQPDRSGPRWLAAAALGPCIHGAIVCSYSLLGALVVNQGLANRRISRPRPRQSRRPRIAAGKVGKQGRRGEERLIAAMAACFSFRATCICCHGSADSIHASGFVCSAYLLGQKRAREFRPSAVCAMRTVWILRY
jgi:hypothetical protein